MSWKSSGGRRSGSFSPFFVLMLLSFFFLIGIVLGQVLAQQISGGSSSELRCYLQDYLQNGCEVIPHGHLIQTVLLLYLKYPMIAFLLGCTAFGVVFLPSAAAIYGFLLSFSISSLMESFGAEGIFLSLAALGIRSVFTVPCFFLIAVSSMERAEQLLSMRHRKEVCVERNGKQRWGQLLVCILILLIGAYLELKFGSTLLEYVLKQFLA